MLWGCTLRNTHKAYGVVIYVGKQTKIVMNSNTVSDKLSHVYIKMNKILYSVLIFQAILMIILSSCAMAWKSQHKYLTYLKTSWTDTLSIEWYNWILFYLLFLGDYANMVPISLYLMSEVIRLIIASWMRKDPEMSDERGGLDVRNSNLIEEIGQLQFIFSDKTGTLTQNKMNFKKCSVNGVAYPD